MTRIEAASRALLGLLGLPTNEPMRSPKHAMKAKNLNDVLGDANVKAVQGKDAVLYLQTLLNEPRRQNLRNRFSHGPTETRNLRKPLADRVFHVLLSHSLIRKA
jgi:hypothetical protein